MLTNPWFLLYLGIVLLTAPSFVLLAKAGYLIRTEEDGDLDSAAKVIITVQGVFLAVIWPIVFAAGAFRFMAVPFTKKHRR